MSYYCRMCEQMYGCERALPFDTIEQYVIHARVAHGVLLTPTDCSLAVRKEQEQSHDPR